MCGIAGFIEYPARRTPAALEATIRSMSARLTHRGPDDEGVWVDAAAGVALGHRRLAILDLSAEGHQPMWSVCGRYCIVFNGEIYNFPALRNVLQREGHTFRGTSDTEVMLAAIVQWGLDRALEQFNGMFAFALWDAHDRTLDLVRDRIGEKPLYYGRAQNTFLFGSELKALSAHPDFNANVDRGALALYLRHGYVPAPHSIFEGIFKLAPGHRLTISSGHAAGLFNSRPYWSARAIADQGIERPFLSSMPEMVTQLDDLLREAVKMRMVTDVPLGAFLSGGIDSSVVVALMQAVSARPAKTFTIGFAETDHDEAPYAAGVARHLGTDHTEVYVGPSDAMNVIPSLPLLYDEPFSDSSQIPTFLVARMARSHVTVALTGDGGDELFGGYGRYVRARQLWRSAQWTPTALRRGAARVLRALRKHAQLVNVMLSPEARRLYEHRLMRLEDCFALTGAATMYANLMCCWPDPFSVVVPSIHEQALPASLEEFAELPDVLSTMMYLDTVGYLPEDILVKVDRAAMGVSLETRVPYLDPRVVEFAWRIPGNMRISKGNGKMILRNLLYRYVPKKLIDRPKKGFSVPVDLWIRGPLREWAEDLLNERRLRCDGFFNPAVVRQMWLEHASGAANWKDRVWNLLMFQAWVKS